jgi:hypothetical protein
MERWDPYPEWRRRIHGLASSAERWIWAGAWLPRFADFGAEATRRADGMNEGGDGARMNYETGRKMGNQGPTRRSTWGSRPLIGRPRKI